MKVDEIRKLVEGTADAAFALDSNGIIAAWNRGAANLFGVKNSEAIGKLCFEVLHGMDECGRDCSETCFIRQKAQMREPLKSYDLRINTNGKKQWCNFSIFIIEEDRSTLPYTLHVARPVELQKRFELLMRDFVAQETNLPAENVREVLTPKKTPTKLVNLTKREIEILHHIAKGEKTKQIAEKLFISPTTVNNHIQKILFKLGAHTRLEAVRRAEKAGLI
ncbi:MAG: LuxR C-terminal-related transcriptional regulator [Pyrinomonadaceae bacterium]